MPDFLNTRNYSYSIYKHVLVCHLPTIDVNIPVGPLGRLCLPTLHVPMNQNQCLSLHHEQAIVGQQVRVFDR